MGLLITARGDLQGGIALIAWGEIAATAAAVTAAAAAATLIGFGTHILLGPSSHVALVAYRLGCEVDFCTTYNFN